MIGYALVGSNDLEKAKSFYDELIGVLGGSKLFDHPSGGRVYGKSQPSFGVCGPYDGQPATVGNGTMIALAADTQQQVRDAFAKAIALGGTSEGERGWRGEPGGSHGEATREAHRTGREEPGAPGRALSSSPRARRRGE